MIEGGSILITGGSGALGTALARHLLTIERGPRRVAIYSRGEHRQFQMSQELASIDQGRLRLFIGDVRDRDRLRRALEDVDIVIHAAALKRIEVGFYNPQEIVRTNIDGSINVIEASHDARVKSAVLISSDKAFQPVSAYGISKAMAECVFLAANNVRGSKGPKHSCCKYGNVWCSTGSVVPVWKKMIQEGATSVPITDPDCTRFFLRMSEAVQLVVDTINTMPTAIVIPTLPAYRLGDLAEAMGVKTHVTGLPAWEKRHESMDHGNSSENARRMTIQELQKEVVGQFD